MLQINIFRGFTSGVLYALYFLMLSNNIVEPRRVSQFTMLIIIIICVHSHYRYVRTMIVYG